MPPPAPESTRARHAWALVVALALLLHAPALSWGFFVDDYSHQLILHGTGEHPSMRPWSVYDFGTLEQFSATTGDESAFPFFTSRDWKVRFFRPLTSCVLWLEATVFGDQAFGYHVVGLVLAGLWLILAWRLWLALGLPPRAALLALVFLGLEDGKVTPVGWIANLNSLLEALFTTATVLVLVRAPRRTSAWLAAFALALGAVLAKESGVAALTLMPIVLWWRTRGSGASSTEGEHQPVPTWKLLTPLLTAALYVVFLAAAGYGARSVFYPTPWNEPGAFLARLAVVVPTGLLAMCGPFAPDVLTDAPGLAPLAVAVSLALVVPLALLIRRVAGAHPAAPLLAVWTLVTLLPRAGATPSDRLVIVSMVGAAGLLGLFVHGAFARPGKRLVRGVGWTVFVLAGPLSGLALLARGFQMKSLADEFRASIVSAEVGPRDEGRRDVVLLQSASQMQTLMPLTAWIALTGDREVRFWPLQIGRRGLVWRRIDAQTFDLESTDRPFFTNAFEGVFRSADESDPVGRTWSTSVFTAEVLARDATGVRSLRFRFEDELERPGLHFLTWRDGAFRQVSPPAVGAERILAEVAPLAPLLP